MGSEGKSKKRRSYPSSDEEEERRRKHRKKRHEREEKEEKNRKRKDRETDKKREKSSRNSEEKEKKSKDKHKHKKKKKKNIDSDFKEISQDDYFSKNNEFATWLREEKNIYFSDLSSESAHDLFSSFVKAWNKGKLELRYYEGIGRGPRTAHNWKIKSDK